MVIRKYNYHLKDSLIWSWRATQRMKRPRIRILVTSRHKDLVG
jgi:hypothetical protein